MILQAGDNTKILMANFTLVRFAVCLHVPHQMAAFEETFGTYLTTMRLLTRVDLFMFQQSLGMGEGLGANITSVHCCWCTGRAGAQ